MTWIWIYELPGAIVMVVRSYGVFGVQLGLGDAMLSLPESMGDVHVV